MRWKLVLPMLLPVIVLFTGPAGAQTVRFANSALTVDEDAGTFDVDLVLDTPTNGGVIVQTADGTASGIGDYAPFFGFVSWQTGDPLTQTITLSVNADAVPEPDETFYVRILSGDGANPGDPSELVVTIRDTTLRPPVAFVLPELYPGGPTTNSFSLRGGQDWNGALRLDAVPASPVTVQVQVSRETTPREVVFDGVQTMPIQVSSPPSSNHGLFEYAAVEIVSGPTPAKLDDQTVSIVWAFENEVRPDIDFCFFCYWDFFFVLAGYVNCNAECFTAINYDCSAAPKRKAETNFMPLLRRYRDEVLSSTVGGSYYADLYAQFSAAAVLAMVDDPSIAGEIWRAKDAWLPAIQALVDGSGSTVFVSVAMRDSLIAILEKMRAAGSSELDQRLSAEMARIDLSSIAGLTMEQFQERIVQAGASVGIEPTSWGDVKARFGH